MDINIRPIQEQFSRHIVGQEDVCHKMVIALITGGHILLTGVPGLGKTAMVKTFAQILNLTFHRIQFTPDLMPSDITGTEILDQGQLRFIEGPVFTNVLLADEINRTPPKTQSALLEAMEERTVTVLGRTRHLASPFLVLATQNPMEFEGTYPLPEAQLDRFFFSIDLTYLSEDRETEMATLTTGVRAAVQPVPMEWLANTQGLVRQMPISDAILRRIVRLVRATRPQCTSLPEVKQGLRWGAGPRAIQNLILSARADALTKTSRVSSCRSFSTA
jgi:MoxR-like ATPase